jgi:mono/diheme cytochrome c family protein
MLLIKRGITAKTFHLGLVILFISLFGSNITNAQDGKALFTQNCAACHAVDKKLTGPALEGVESRWNDNRKKLHDWIHNNQAFLKTGDAYANKMYVENNKIPMLLFPNLSDNDIDAILDYIKNWKPAPAAAAATISQPADSTFLLGVLFILLGIIGLILMRVNKGLRNISLEKQGIETPVPLPFYRNNIFIAAASILLFLLGGYCITKSAIGLGRNQDYQPVQPVFYSHKVHAGVNQINCLYCHGGAQDSRHASVPSLNVCMNCHMAINDYKGEKLYTAEGKEINGTDEIKKLYDYAGFTPGQPWDASKAKPIEWVGVHNLPDHVYFNHSQHIMVGKVQCQTCHGDITKMDEVKQFSDLSMGWCINCHRTTQVQFADNKFYSIYTKYHNEMNEGKIDTTKGITVEMIGGTECQKCHY